MSATYLVKIADITVVCIHGNDELPSYSGEIGMAPLLRNWSSSQLLWWQGQTKKLLWNLLKAVSKEKPHVFES